MTCVRGIAADIESTESQTRRQHRALDRHRHPAPGAQRGEHSAVSATATPVEVLGPLLEVADDRRERGRRTGAWSWAARAAIASAGPAERLPAAAHRRRPLAGLVVLVQDQRGQGLRV